MDVAQIPQTMLSVLKTALSSLTSSKTPLLPFVPKSVKVLLLVVLLLNASSAPLLWHIRVWYYPLRAYYLAYTRGTLAYWRGWKKECDAAGGLAGLRPRITRRALFDDCDYNMHLSNSCYAKNSDASKMQYCIAAFAPIYYSGVHTPLGATHWSYIKEIPLGAEYVMETRMGGWGEKWIHLVTEFIIYPKGKRGGRPADTVRNASAAQTPPMPLGDAVTADPSGAATPASGAATPGAPGADATEALRRASARARAVRPDGGIVCCVTVADYCFKMGRITIPPRVAMWISMHSPARTDHARAIAILLGKDKGRAWLRGGWKNEEDADELGLDLGQEGAGSSAWAERGRDAAEQMAVGMAAF